METTRLALTAALAAALVFCSDARGAAPDAGKTVFTEPQNLGKATARVYVTLDARGNPLALGVSFDKGALDGLPAEPNPTSRCFDKDGDGKIDPRVECIGDHELVFELPQGVAAEAVSPFKWVGVNWNSHGHAPPAPPAWAEPHFDFHFYTVDRQAVKAIRPGPCGELIDCDDFQKARKPVPARYVHPDYIDVGAAVPDMGNHLINAKAPELAKNGPKFTHTFIFGAYDGRIIFNEPMITHAYLSSNPRRCPPIKQPKGWEIGGFYPTRYCVRHAGRSGTHAVSLEGFVRRLAR